MGVMIKPGQIAGKEHGSVSQILAWSGGFEAVRALDRVVILPEGGQAG
jgi:hypothetical protein